MKAIECKTEVCAKLKAIKGFEKAFPHLIEQLSKGNVWAWDNHAYTTELTDAQRQHIEELERTNAKYGLTVYAVLDNYMILGGCDEVHMESYLYISNESGCVTPAGKGAFYAIASVKNISWELEEMGDIIIQSSLAGGPIRLG